MNQLKSVLFRNASEEAKRNSDLGQPDRSKSAAGSDARKSQPPSPLKETAPIIVESESLQMNQVDFLKDLGTEFF